MKTCVDCGRSRCRGGAIHDILSAARQNERDGYVRAAPHAQVLRAAGVELRSCPTSLSAGGPGRRQKVHWSNYAPVNAVAAAYLLADVPFRERIRLMRAALDEDSVLIEQRAIKVAGGVA